jgi:hypothetical protein
LSAPSCASCGKLLPTASLRYVVEITVTADFDPMVVYPDDLDAETNETLEAMQVASERGLASKLGEQLMARRAFMLCPPCREQFLADMPGEAQ